MKEYSNVDELMEQAKQEDLDEACMLGELYISGAQMPKDPDKAQKWLRLAADRDHPRACFLLGCLFIDNEINVEEGVGLVRKSAQLGFAPAQDKLGIMLNVGQYVRRDEDEAMKWFEAAAVQGDAKGQYNLGHALYNKSLECENEGERFQLMSKATAWLKKAYVQGDENAEKMLSDMDAL